MGKARRHQGRKRYPQGRHQVQGSLHHDPRRCLQHREGHRRCKERTWCREVSSGVPRFYRRGVIRHPEPRRGEGSRCETIKDRSSKMLRSFFISLYLNTKEY